MQTNDLIQAGSTLMNFPTVCPQDWYCRLAFLLSLSFYYWLEVFNHCCVVCLQVGVVDSPPRVFNSPYTTATSIDYNPIYRMSEFKVCNLVETPFLISMSYEYYFVCFILHFWSDKYRNTLNFNENQRFVENVVNVTVK